MPRRTEFTIENKIGDTYANNKFSISKKEGYYTLITIKNTSTEWGLPTREASMCVSLEDLENIVEDLRAMIKLVKQEEESDSS